MQQLFNINFLFHLRMRVVTNTLLSGFAVSCVVHQFGFLNVTEIEELPAGSIGQCSVCVSQPVQVAE